MLATLPLAWLRALGSGVGWILYRIDGREAYNARVNLALCFPELDTAAREALLRTSLRETGKTYLEMAKIWFDRRTCWPDLLDSNGLDVLMGDLRARGKAFILAGPHQGNWEMAGQMCGHVNMPLTALYRPPRRAVLERIIVEGRRRSGGAVEPASRKGVAAMNSALRRAEGVFILPDQLPKSKDSAGVYAPFFGHPALTMTLINRLAHKHDAVVIFYFAERLPGAQGFRARYFLGEAAISGADVMAGVAALNRGVEACVRLCPSQYQWTYRRFDIPPDGQRGPYHR